MGNLWAVWLELAPWLLLGSLVAGLLHVLIPEGFIRRKLGKPGMGGIVKAAMAGVPMPLCSCGVIPVGIGLRKDGASRGASVSFLVSTPQTAVDSTFVSYSFLGLPFAVFKLVSSFMTGILAGVLAHSFGGPEETFPESNNPSAKTEEPGNSRYPSLRSKAKGVWKYGVDELLYMIWGWVVVGVLVSAALTTFIPQDFFGNIGMTTGFGGLIMALLISLPMYACSTASVPIAAGLVHAGLPPGAALVYLVAGPATNVATMGAILRVFGKRVLSIYLLVIITASLFFGYMFDYLVDMTAMRIHDHATHEHGGLMTIAAACLLLGIFVKFALTGIRNRLDGRRASNSSLEHITLRVDGMSCQGCAVKLRSAFNSIPNIRHADVNLALGQVRLNGMDMEEDSIRNVISGAGYEPGARIE